MKSINAKAFCLFSMLTALISVIVRIIISANYTNAKTGVYLHGTHLPQIYGYILAFFLIGIAIWALISKKDFDSENYPASTVLTVFTTAAFGFIMLFCTLFFLFVAISQRNTDVFELVMAISGALSSIYYLSQIFSRKTNQAARGLLSIAPIIWSICALIELYFDMSILVSSPNRIFGQLAYLSLMVFLLAESKVELGYESTKLYAPSAAICTILLLTSSIPNLICMDIMMIGESDRPITYAVQLVAGLYAASKLISFCFFTKLSENK